MQRNVTSACCRTGFPLRSKPAANAGVIHKMATDNFLSKKAKMIKEKYKELCLPLQFGGTRTVAIHGRFAAYKESQRANRYIWFLLTHKINTEKLKQPVLLPTLD